MEAYIAKLYVMYDAMSVPKTVFEAGCSEEVFLDQLDDILYARTWTKSLGYSKVHRFDSHRRNKP